MLRLTRLARRPLAPFSRARRALAANTVEHDVSFLEMRARPKYARPEMPAETHVVPATRPPPAWYFLSLCESAVRRIYYHASFHACVCVCVTNQQAAASHGHRAGSP